MGSSFNRLGSFIAPSIVGFLLAEYSSIALVFAMFSVVALFGAVVMGTLGEETKRRTLEELDQQPGDLEHAVQLLRKHGALRDTLERARHYGALARSALDVFHDGPEKRALIEAVDFSVARAY